MRNSHAQTVICNFLPRQDDLPPVEEMLVRVDAETQVLCHLNWHSQQAPTLVLVHGLEGSSHSHYAIGTANRVWRLGWNVVRMNMRNCCGTEHLTPTLYHSGLSGDLQAVVAQLIAGRGCQRIAIAGFSLGGNLVLKCAGEWGATPPPEVFAAAAVSPCCDLAASGRHVHRFPSFLYEWWFLRRLKNRLRRKATLYPQRYDLSQIARARSIRSFDNLYTAPLMGFADAREYYATQSASRLMDQIAVPTLLIHAADDPVVFITPETENKIRANRSILYLKTAHGGHCGFFEDSPAPGDDGRWAERSLVEFLEAVRQEEE
jgi:hypothetical protein